MIGLLEKDCEILADSQGEDDGDLPKQPVDLKIITGMSGAGKTQVIQVLEDLDYFCVDNLPPNLFVKFAELASQSQFGLGKIALVADVRGGKFFLDLFDVLEELKAKNIHYEIVFLEASDEVLVRRFKETRRRHPLSYTGSVLEGIMEERKRLQTIRGMADVIFDTSNLKVQAFKEQIIKAFQDGTETKLNISVMSFGYKYGLPIDADLVMDVRFLPNPYYIEELKRQTGENPAVRDFVLTKAVTINFLDKYSKLLLEILPDYIIEGKKHLEICIGCTGGQHRSVAIACALGEILQEATLDASQDLQGIIVKVGHRDIEKSKL